MGLLHFCFSRLVGFVIYLGVMKCLTEVLEHFISDFGHSRVKMRVLAFGVLTATNGDLKVSTSHIGG